MIRDQNTHAAESALADYCLAHRPTTQKTHALLMAVMELVSERSGLTVRMVVGDAVIYREDEMNELALFAGAGGGILGGHLLGWRTVCAVEFEPYAAGILVARQNEGLLHPFPIWDDVRTFDGTAWRGLVDVVSGGFPCQDISPAGKGGGIDGKRSGLWREMARIVAEVRPKHVFVENSPTLTSRGLGAVLGDLAALGFDARWDVLGAAHIGACHWRERIWIRADRADLRGNRSWASWQRKPQLQNVVSREQHRKAVTSARGNHDALAGRLGKSWHAIGNGQVPAVAAAAFDLLNR